MQTKHKQPVTLVISHIAPVNPIDLTGVNILKKVFKDGTEKTFKVQRHHLGLCNGCHGHSNKLCDSVKCYNKATPAASYRLVDLTFNRNTREFILGE